MTRTRLEDPSKEGMATSILEEELYAMTSHGEPVLDVTRRTVFSVGMVDGADFGLINGRLRTV